MKYWEIIADNLSASGWSWGCISALYSNGRTIWIAGAHRGDGGPNAMCRPKSRSGVEQTSQSPNIIGVMTCRR
jgi:hypothetical protein